MAAKRYTSGVTDLSSSDPAGAFAVLDPSKYSKIHIDFASDAPDIVTQTGAVTSYVGAWFVSGLTNGASTIVADAGLTGCGLKIDIGGANDNAGMLHQKNGFMVMESGKKFFLESKFEVTSATMADGEFFVGLSTIVAANGIANWVAADGLTFTHDDAVGFYKVDDTAAVLFTSRENDVASTVQVMSTFVTATWVTLSLYFDGTVAYLYQDGTHVATITPGQVPVTPVVPSFYFKTGKGEVASVIFDYLTVIAEM